jgi:GDPmannose 4,6-dehydratase
VNKTALIVGIAGQDGSYLAELLAAKGYRVVGAEKSAAPPGARFENLARLGDAVEVVECNVRDAAGVRAVVESTEPDEIYNFAGTTNVADTWNDPVRAAEETALGPLHLLEAVRLVRPETRFFQASSSEMFGAAATAPQNEETSLRPWHPYGSAKVFAHTMVGNYRARYGLFACSGILFNHESPRRPPLFVTRKIARGAARVKLGLDPKLELGALDARRDWGFAPDFVAGMWAMLQTDTPDDFVLGTGEQRTVRDFCEVAFARVGLDYRDHVAQSGDFVRATDTSNIVADASKAARVLGWRAVTPFRMIVDIMVDAEMEREAAAKP